MRIILFVLVLVLISSCQVNINTDHIVEGTKLLQQGDYLSADREFDDALFADENNPDSVTKFLLLRTEFG